MPLAPKSFQDIITFSRSTGNATYYNSSGYLTTAGILNYLTYSNTPENAAWNKQDSFVQTNLFRYSEQFDNAAAWSNSIGGTGVASTVTANQGTAPDGTLTADRIQFNLGGGATIADLTRRIQSYVTAAVTHTYSIYVRSFDGVSTYNMHIVGSTGATTNIVVTGSWQRFEVSAVGTGGSVAYAIGLRGGQTPANSNTADVLVWGAQLVQGAVPGDYQATTAAALPVLYADWTGALTARKICQNAVAAVPHGLRQSPSGLTGSTTYTLSFYAKAGESTKANAWQFTGAVFTTTAHATYDLVAGTATGDGSPTIQSVGNGWYRCTKTITTVASPVTGTIHIGPTDAAGNQVYNGDGTSGVYITDMQIEVGTSVGPYYETTTSQYNAPRFDYNPATLQPLGLLIEEQRTNLLLQSNDFATTWITTANTNRTAGQALSPAGNIDAWRFYSSNGLVSNGLYQSVTKAATATQYTWSIYAKPAGYNWIQLAVFDGIADGNRYWFNLSTGVLGSTGVIGAGFTGVSATITNVGNGWYRCSLIATSNTAVQYQAYMYPTNADGVTTAGDASLSGVFIYGAQLEVGAFATSYIPTVASQVTRAADVASVDTLSPWFNQAVGTFYAEFDIYGVSGSGNILGDGTVGTSIAYLNTSFNLVSYNGVSGPTTSNATAANIVAKASLAYITNNRRAILNAGGASNQPGSLQVVNKLELGKAFGNTFLNGHLRRVTFYPRQLTIAEQQTLTTL